MKITLLRRAAVAGLFAIACAPLQAATIRLVADPWCPYNCEPGSDRPGFMIEIAQRVFAEAGHQVVYSNLTWTRAIVEARRGNYEGIVGTTPDNSPDFVFPEVATGGGSSNVFFVKADSEWRYAGMASLDRISLGVIGGYSYFDALDAYVEQYKRITARVQPAYGDQALAKLVTALEEGRIDAFIEDRQVVNFFLRDTGRDGALKEAGQDEAADDTVYIAFSPASPQAKEYAALLSQGMDRLRASGELAKILARYGLKDWQR